MTLAQQGLIAEGQRGQRRGIVLGFTMAELMLLLLFCLLLVSAGILQDKNSELDQQRVTIEQLESLSTGEVSLDEMAALRAAEGHFKRLLLLLFPDGLPPRMSPAQVDDLWRELVLAKDTHGRVMDVLEPDNALAPPDEEDMANLLLTLQVLAAGGFTDLTPEQIERLAAYLRGPDGGISQDRLDALAQILEALRNSDAMTPDRVAAALAVASDPSFDPGRSGHRWPPIISLGDDGNRFATGSAEITEAFKLSLQSTIAGQVAEMLETYGVDVIEIIGHTDEQQIRPTEPSNLDAEAIAALRAGTAVESLRAADNAGLGLARAIAVARILLETGRFDDVKIAPLSAAQLLLPGDALSDGSRPANDASRRRIEIRVRRTSSTQ